MAEIAFGKVEERRELLGLLSDDKGRTERIAYLTDRLRTRPAPKTNRILVSRDSNIAHVADVRLFEGQAVIVRPTGASFDVLGTVMPEEW